MERWQAIAGRVIVAPAIGNDTLNVVPAVTERCRSGR